MRAFRSGERDFVKDEIVFVVDKLDNFMNILIGKINTYAGYGKYYVDLYTVTEKKKILIRILISELEMMLVLESGLTEGI